MGKVIGILSGKGGVGKTTVVSNLGAAMNDIFGKKTLILDGNVSTSHLGMHFGLYEDLPVTLKDVLTKRAPPAYAMYVHPSTGVRVLPAPLKSEMGMKLTRLNKIIRNLKKDYDIIILDFSPGLGKEVISLIKTIDMAYIVANPELPSVTDALKTIDLLKKKKKEIAGVILNRIKNVKYELSLGEVESTCGQNVISLIPEDKKVPESIAKGIPLVIYSSHSPAARELKKLAAWMVGERYYDSGLLDWLKGLFRIKPNYETNNVGLLSRPVLALRKRQKKRKFKKMAKKDLKTAEKVKSELDRELKKQLKEEVVKKIKEKLGD